MRRLIAAATLSLVLCPGLAAAVDLHWGAMAGYNHGLGARGELAAVNLFKGVPLGFAFGLGYTRLDPGNAGLARRVFINEATDGTPEKSGYFLDFRLDAIWYLQMKGFERVGVFGGIRRDMFRGDFRFVGGDEDFEVRADDWGLGVGARGEMRLTRGLNLVGSVGVDFYPVSTLYGHDATYTSTGGGSNHREDFTWKDADKAVNQPRLLPTMMVGLVW